MGPFATLVSVWGCGQPTGPDGCAITTGATSNDACAVVQGSVVDTMGRPVPGVTIRVDDDDREGFAIIFHFPPTGTDSVGHFESRAARLVTLNGPGDTITVPLTASLLTANGSLRTAVVDVLLRFFPIGEVPEPTTVRIILPDG